MKTSENNVRNTAEGYEAQLIEAVAKSTRYLDLDTA